MIIIIIISVIIVFSNPVKLWLTLIHVKLNMGIPSYERLRVTIPARQVLNRYLYFIYIFSKIILSQNSFFCAWIKLLWGLLIIQIFEMIIAIISNFENDTQVLFFQTFLKLEWISSVEYNVKDV